MLQPGEPARAHETERFQAFTYDELVARDKASLDIFWLKDESLEDTGNLPAPVTSRQRSSRTLKLPSQSSLLSLTRWLTSMTLAMRASSMTEGIETPDPFGDWYPAKERPWYDVAQVCLHGHLINDRTKTDPQNDAAYCPVWRGAEHHSLPSLQCHDTRRHPLSQRRRTK